MPFQSVISRMVRYIYLANETHSADLLQPPLKQITAVKIAEARGTNSGGQILADHIITSLLM